MAADTAAAARALNVHLSPCDGGWSATRYRTFFAEDARAASHLHVALTGTASACGLGATATAAIGALIAERRAQAARLRAAAEAVAAAIEADAAALARVLDCP